MKRLPATALLASCRASLPACRYGCNRESSISGGAQPNCCSHPAKLMIAGWRTAVPPLLLLAAQVPPAPRSARRCSAQRCRAPAPALRARCMPRTAALSGGGGGDAAELIVGGARRDRRPLAAARAARGHRRGCDRNSRCTRRRPPTRGSRCTGHLAEVQHACGTHLRLPHNAKQPPQRAETNGSKGVPVCDGCMSYIWCCTQR